MKRLKPKILVVGTCRNVSKTLQREVHRIKREFSFCDIEFFIVESDSSDSTITQLSQLKDDQSLQFDFVSMGALSDKIANRVERITFCRNVYVNHFKAQVDVDYVMVVDFDQRNYLLSKKILEHLQQSTSDVIFCSQLFLYDIYSLVEAGQKASNPWRDLFNDPEFGHNPIVAYRKHIISRMRYMPKNANMIVTSYFGGVGLYTAQAFSVGSRYECKIGEQTICEHIPFNNRIFEAGMRLEILGRSRNFFFNTHTLPKLLNLFNLDGLLIPKIRKKSLSFDE